MLGSILALGKSALGAVGGWSGLAKLGLPILGDLLGSDMQSEFNAKEAAKQREWQTEMSNTQYQRAADDLEAAGLNRILALGSPAGVPSGATASMDMPRIGQTGILASSAKQQIAQSKAEENLIKQREQESVATENLANANAGQSYSQTILNEANAQLAKQTARLTSAKAIKEERLSPVYEEVGALVNSIRDLLHSGDSNAKDAINSNNIFKNLSEKLLESDFAKRNRNPKNPRR